MSLINGWGAYDVNELVFKIGFVLIWILRRSFIDSLHSYNQKLKHIESQRYIYNLSSGKRP